MIFYDRSAIFCGCLQILNLFPSSKGVFLNFIFWRTRSIDSSTEVYQKIKVELYKGNTLERTFPWSRDYKQVLEANRVGSESGCWPVFLTLTPYPFWAKDELGRSSESKGRSTALGCTFGMEPTWKKKKKRKQNKLSWSFLEWELLEPRAQGSSLRAVATLGFPLGPARPPQRYTYTR